MAQFRRQAHHQQIGAIAKCSLDAALSDITDLLARGVLRKSEAGRRSASYKLTGLPMAADST